MLEKLKKILMIFDLFDFMFRPLYFLNMLRATRNAFASYR